MKLWKMSEAEIESYRDYCIKMGNCQALSELNDFHKWYGKRVLVVKGRKVKIGTTGKVFYVERKHYAPQEWKGWVTIVGFETEGGDKFFTNELNIAKIEL